MEKWIYNESTTIRKMLCLQKRKDIKNREVDFTIAKNNILEFLFSKKWDGV